MKAVFLTGPQTIEVMDVPEPSLPDDGLLLRVAACGVCGSDVRRWKAGPDDGVERVLPGHEAAGIVLAVAPGVRGYAVGDRLAIAPDVHCGRCYYCQRGLYNLCDDLRLVGITPSLPGGMAEVMPVPGVVLTRGIVHQLPFGLGLEHAALSEPLSSVMACQEQVNVGLGDVVVVLGAGPIGCMHVAIARARGARVIVSQRSEPRSTLVQEFGPESVVNPRVTDLGEAVRNATGGVGADVVICSNPSPEAPQQGVEIARKGGTVVLFGGLPKADPTIRLDGNIIHYGQVSVLGSFSYHPTVHQAALDALARGLIPAEALITHRLPLEQTDEAFEIAARGEGLKTMIVMEGDE